MRILRALLPAFILFMQPGIVVGANSDDACTIPSDLEKQIQRTYHTYRIVTLRYLEEYDRSLFQKDHKGSCPGLVSVDFYGDGKPTLALVLITKRDKQDDTQLIVAHETAKGWSVLPLDTGGGSDGPVVWSLRPGEYNDVYGNKTIRAKMPVIVFSKYEAWAILYAWTGKKVSKIWLVD